MNALDEIISDLGALSKEELHAKLKQHEGGIVGGAILNCNPSLRSWFDSEVDQYIMQYEQSFREIFEINEMPMDILLVADVVNRQIESVDYSFPMAA